MNTCERVFVSPDGEQRDCGKTATHEAYWGTCFFCPECLHACMEDASPEEQASVKELASAIPCAVRGHS